MKQIINIEILTSVHIGSGAILNKGIDFIFGRVDDTPSVGIVDAKKVFALIGEDNLEKWLAAINRGIPTDSFLKQLGKNVQLDDYCSRVLDCYCPSSSSSILRTFIYDGMGSPYIPGSSIKGAIRSAVLASTILGFCNPDELPVLTGRFPCSEIEKQLFGNIQGSVFRYLRISDAHFGNNYLGVVDLAHINERKSNSYYDTSKGQLVEILIPGDCSSFGMNLDLDYYKFCHKECHSLPDSLESMERLFICINKHTERLILQEIERWEPLSRSNHEGEDVLEEYISCLHSIHKQIISCREGRQCILRIGFGSGWRFITGAWSERIDNFEYKILKQHIRKFDFDKYRDYTFPKTRRIEKTQEYAPLGFVKLSF